MTSVQETQRLQTIQLRKQEEHISHDSIFSFNVQVFFFFFFLKDILVALLADRPPVILKA